MGPLGTSLVAWIGVPLVLYVAGVGLGLLAERLTRLRLPDALLAPVGFCAAIVLVMPGYRLGAGAWLGAPLLAAAAAVGLLLARRELPRRLSPGWPGAAGLGVYLLYMAPVLAAGGWTWTGYNFVNDTAVQFLLADHVAQQGAAIPAGPPEHPPHSNAVEHVRIYLETAYPLGIHTLLASLDALVPAPLPAIYQPTISVAAGFAAMALSQLAVRAGTSMRLAALVGFAALAANLTYNYALQGNAKEIGVVAALAAAAAVSREALSARRPVAAVAVVAVCVAAAISLFSAAALPYAGALAVALALAAFIQPRSPIRRRLVHAAAVGSLLAAVLSLATLVEIVHFGEVVEASYAQRSKNSAVDEYGQLARPLPLVQASGVWLAGDYRFAVVGTPRVFTSLLVLAIAAAFAVGVGWLSRRREAGPLILLFTMGLPLAVLALRVSPYATGKMLALVSPAVVFVAALGLVAAVRAAPRLRGVAYGLGALILAGILASDVYAYRTVKLAPIDRLEALREAADRIPRHELFLVDDFEEFAKYFTRERRQNAGLEAITPRPAWNRVHITYLKHHADLDQMPLRYVDSFPWIVQRMGPEASRPPVSYRLVYRNRWWAVWRRTPGQRAIVHVPLQSLGDRTSEPPCDAIRRLAARARPEDRVVAAVPTHLVRFDLPSLAREGWPRNESAPDTVSPATPGSVSQTQSFQGGSYRVWVRGSLGRRVDISVDGLRMASASGINTTGEWLPAGRIQLDAGHHDVEVIRPTGSLRPGDRYTGELGQVVFERVERPTMRTARPAEAARRFCGRRLDWLELRRG